MAGWDRPRWQAGTGLTRDAVGRWVRFCKPVSTELNVGGFGGGVECGGVIQNMTLWVCQWDRWFV